MITTASTNANRFSVMTRRPGLKTGPYLISAQSEDRACLLWRRVFRPGGLLEI